MRITFEPPNEENAKADTVRIEERQFVNGEWARGSVLDDDQSHQGRHLRLSPGDVGIQKLELYRYE